MDWYGVVRTGFVRLFWVTFFLLFCLYLSSLGAPGGSNLGVVLALLGLGSWDDRWSCWLSGILLLISVLSVESKFFASVWSTGCWWECARCSFLLLKVPDSRLLGCLVRTAFGAKLLVCFFPARLCCYGDVNGEVLIGFGRAPKSSAVFPKLKILLPFLHFLIGVAVECWKVWGDGGTPRIWLELFGLKLFRGTLHISASAQHSLTRRSLQCWN